MLQLHNPLQQDTYPLQSSDAVWGPDGVLWICALVYVTPSAHRFALLVRAVDNDGFADLQFTIAHESEYAALKRVPVFLYEGAPLSVDGEAWSVTRDEGLVLGLRSDAGYRQTLWRWQAALAKLWSRMGQPISFLTAEWAYSEGAL
jgi:hypothetical protein